MQLYFSPLACSMATRITLYDAGVAATFTEVDARTKRTVADGDGPTEDFTRVNPLGLVPTLRTDDGVVLTENAAILQYVADQHPDAQLAPTDPIGRARLQQWLCFIGTELHKAVFAPIFDRKAPDAARAYAVEKGASRFDLVAAHLADREHLLDRFSVADAYLVTVLTWTVATPVQLAKWPALVAYLERMRKRPSVARAFSEERVLYAREQARVAQ